jgi:hypothetical protein
MKILIGKHPELESKREDKEMTKEEYIFKLQELKNIIQSKINVEDQWEDNNPYVTKGGGHATQGIHF